MGSCCLCYYSFGARTSSSVKRPAVSLFAMRREQGFTIPELLVVVSIILLMTGLMLPNWRSGERTLALDRVVHKAGQDVRRVQELALRAQAYTCLNDPAERISGYGVFFDQNNPISYTLFAECNANNTYNAGIDGIVETIEIESGIEIQSVSPGPQISIVFVPPTPLVFLKPDDPPSARVFFQRADGVGIPKTLEVTSKGVIDID